MAKAKKMLLSTQYHRKKKVYVQNIIPFTPVLAKKDNVRECTEEEARIVQAGGLVPAKLPADGMKGHTQMFIPDELVPRVKTFVERFMEQENAPQPLPPSEEFPAEDGVQLVSHQQDTVPIIDPATGLPLPDANDPKYAPNPDPDDDLLSGDDEILDVTGLSQKESNLGPELQDGVRDVPFEVVKMQKAKSKNDLEIFAAEHLGGTVVVDRSLTMDVIKSTLTEAYQAQMVQPDNEGVTDGDQS